MTAPDRADASARRVDERFTPAERLLRETRAELAVARAGAADQAARIAELEQAILWALGYPGEGKDFRPRMEGEGAYWWRTELRQRARLSTEGEKGHG